MEQKFFITDSQYDVQGWLDKGWMIVSVTAQHVSTGSSQWLSGKFAIVIEKKKPE
jgi:hypothetical protein